MAGWGVGGVSGFGEVGGVGEVSGRAGGANFGGGLRKRMAVKLGGVLLAIAMFCRLKSY